MSEAAVPARGDSRGDLKGTVYEIFILAISIISIANMAMLFIFEFESAYWWVVADIDVVLTLIFVLDFVYRLRTAPSKSGYLRHGGAFDFLGCLPGLRIFRVFRIVRAVRVLRRLGGPQVLRDLRGQLASGTLYLIVFLGILTLEVIALLELYFEQDAPGANITSGGDALWWGYVTATTVGYGDQFPVTMGGRIVGTLMLTIGVALFATFSGFLAQAFLSNNAERPTTGGDGSAQAALADVERLLAEQQAATETLRARLLELERA
jgi:voltage-gated potassium channel Kch